jgi:ADP-ribosylglycohydrolase
MDVHTVEMGDRASGSYIGNAVGDALGAPYEFGFRNLPDDENPEMLGGGLGNYRPGEWTDDTQLMVTLAVTAANPHPLLFHSALDVVSAGFWEWAKGDATDIGITTSAALNSKTPLTGVEQIAKSREVYELTKREGNGSIMRTAPVGVKMWNSNPDDRANTARVVSELTHAGPEAVTACIVWSHAIAVAVETGTFSGVKEGAEIALRMFPEQTWVKNFLNPFMVTPRAVSDNQYAKGCALAAWAAISVTGAQRGRYNDLDGALKVETALNAAVHAGGDTDTVAAVTGALVGAVYGANAIPARWVEKVHGLPKYNNTYRGREDLKNLALAAASLKL